MRSPIEILALHDEHARSGVAFAEMAEAGANAPLAIQNWSGATGSRFFRALIGWRTGLIDPAAELRVTVELSERAVGYARSPGAAVFRDLLDTRPGAYAALLIGQPENTTLDELERLAVPKPPRDIPEDIPLSAWLASVLRGNSSGGGRLLVERLGRQKRLALLAHTFANYFDLADLGPTDASVAADLTTIAVDLFKRRRKDSFFGGGIQYQGGDAYNDIVIDFHLAAVWRVRGWDPSSLPADVRQHVALPG